MSYYFTLFYCLLDLSCSELDVYGLPKNVRVVPVIPVCI